MERAMRRKDRAVPEAEAREILANAEYGMLATVCEDGQPYCIPLSFVLMEGAVYFHCAKMGQKIDNIARDSRVCFSAAYDTQPIYDNDFTTYYKSAVVFGRAGLVMDDGEKDRALSALCEKYLPDHMDKVAEGIAKSRNVTAVYRIDIERITGKAKRRPETM